MTTTEGGWTLPISERELAGLTRELHEAHQDTLPAMRAGARDLVEEVRARGADGPRDLGRRRFLLGAGGAAAALTLAACSSSGSTGPTSSGSGAPAPAPGSPSGSGSGSGSGASGQYTGDLKVVALATALENQAVGAYQAALDAAKAGRLGTVPPAVATFITTAMGQHVDHAKVWNSVLTGAGKPAITDVPLSNQPATLQALGAAADVATVAKLALSLEDQAAQTYLFATYNVTSPGGIATAATIAPVEAMHAAILNYVLGQYPVPDDFLPVDKAAGPGLLTV
ncbi:ferritin-like domain-containing protein [Kitasatospora purpeofusca]|uniref:ferritin-like domain-containing protein n=1 Tax=Kitasatospora purpeofusca TaxID=67352 RepID=UPI002250F283|nr:ferritin-like domain-containing protein [Kitasatospora purpeofusca]MCX4755580.1 ferritin-like domain-containing protein [Kitasatospora purpeofusca]WSR36553.1 ferritin-like domain-containing protein [Kitasatospora purpeofusca]